MIELLCLLFVCVCVCVCVCVSASYPGGSRQDQLLPLVVTLRECVREASQKARAAMSVVLLQEALASSHHHTPLLTHRRDAVFSQAVCVCV